MIHRVALLGSIFALTACSAAANAVPPSLPLSQSVARSARAPSVYVAESCQDGSTSCSSANGLVYQLGGRTITAGVANPVAVAVGNSGNLFVSNALTVDNGNITVYAPGSRRVLRTIGGYPGVSYAFVFSPSNELYVVSHYKSGCCQIKGSVRVYPPGGTHPIRQLSGVGAFPGKPVFDESGNLYVPNFYNFPGYIAEYKPGATTPFRAITDGIGFPLALLMGGHAQLYVLNGVFGGGTDILVFAHARASLSRTITQGVSNASAIALDSHGRLYVANRGGKHVPPSVSVYAPGASKPELTIRTGIRNPIALAFDARGALYVANAALRRINTVTVYAPGAVIPEKTYRLSGGAMALTSDFLHVAELASGV
jgi:hypothetical protein